MSREPHVAVVELAWFEELHLGYVGSDLEELVVVVAPGIVAAAVGVTAEEFEVAVGSVGVVLESAHYLRST